MKWVEIAIENQRTRFGVFSQFLKENGIENTVEFIEATPTYLKENLEEAQKKFDHIRLGPGLGHVATTMFKHNTAIMHNLKTADGLIKVDDKWWLRSAAFHSMQKILTGIGSGLDIESSVLIVGAGSMARVAVAALAKVGFSEFNLSNQFDDQALELIREFEGTYFNIKFNFIPKDELILLPGTNGVVVNTSPFNKANEILEELYYFNFLKSGGITIDFVMIPPETPLIKEAHTIGSHVVKGYEIAAHTDIVWAKWCLDVDLDVDAYASLLKKSVTEAPNQTDNIENVKGT